MASSRQLFAPPRYLLGGVVAIWGYFTEHLLIALSIAFFIEGSLWLKWRWDFGTKGYRRAWLFSVGLTFLGLFYYYLNAGGFFGLLNFVPWLPVYFLPLILAQTYGRDGEIPATAFSALALQREKKARLLGRSFHAPTVHFGYPYLAICLVSTGHRLIGSEQQGLFALFLFVVLLVSFYYRQRRMRVFAPAFLLAIALVSALAFGGTIGIRKLYYWVSQGRFEEGFSTLVTEDRQTAIGKVMEVKLSKRVQWRVNFSKKISHPLLRPQFLMTAAYNRYDTHRWSLENPDGQPSGRASIPASTSALARHEGEFSLIENAFHLNDHEQPYIRIRGAVESNRELLPLPTQTGLIANAEEIDEVEYNLLGTTLASNASAMIDFRAYQSSQDNSREATPSSILVLNAKDVEKSNINYIPELGLSQALSTSAAELNHILAEIVDELGLLQMKEEHRILAIRKFFKEFQYSSDLTIQNDAQRHALTKFLVSEKRGHCEYFASAGALLLRAAGIPTRYVVGYVIDEKNREGDFIVRGSHGHAWCRAYLGGTQEIIESTDISEEEGEVFTQFSKVYTGGQWVDIDFTPPGWIQAETQNLSWTDRLADNFQLWREDFELWRSQTESKSTINTALGAVGLVTLVFIIWRLNQSRLRVTESPQKTTQPFPFKPTQLNDLIEKLEERFGPRPLGALPTEWFQKLGFIQEDERETVRNALSWHERIRFREEPLSQKDQSEFQRSVQDLEQLYSQRFKKG